MIKQLLSLTVWCSVVAFVVTAGVIALVPPVHAQESLTQMALVRSPEFLLRIEYLALQQARSVKAEALTTACHAKRSRYADDLLAATNQSMIPRLAAVIVGGVNLIGTVRDVAPGATSTATDAAILSQIATFWNAISGCDTGS